ncbi:hypothetical protein pb186bvf_006576 [Paramecium bursaria]
MKSMDLNEVQVGDHISLINSLFNKMSQPNHRKQSTHESIEVPQYSAIEPIPQDKISYEPLRQIQNIPSSRNKITEFQKYLQRKRQRNDDLYRCRTEIDDQGEPQMSINVPDEEIIHCQNIIDKAYNLFIKNNQPSQLNKIKLNTLLLSSRISCKTPSRSNFATIKKNNFKI